LIGVLQAGRGRLAVGHYHGVKDHWESQGEAQVMTLEELDLRIQQPTLVGGELTAEARQVLSRRRKVIHLVSPAHSLRRPAVLAELAWHRFQANQTDEVISLAPIYLHVAGSIPD
jgi:tRNA threonylcarbamoyladenosine biosynthesis protein TsaB